MGGRSRPSTPSARPSSTAHPFPSNTVEPARKRRLDVVLVELGLAETRERAQALVMAGHVLVDGQVARRVAAPVRTDAAVELRARLPYVGRGGFKLAHALDRFGIDVADRVAVDVGASTGGFTDVLLQRGAARVYAVDVGYGQLDARLRCDGRVVVLDRTNIRHLERLPEPCDLATIDVSFISLRLVLPAARRLLAGDWAIIALIKPQFEAGRDRVGRGGVVRDSAVHRDVLRSLARWSAEEGFAWQRLAASPVLGAAGNVEFLVHLTSADPAAIDSEALVDAVLTEAANVAAREQASG